MPVNINGYALSNPDDLTFGASGTKVRAADYGIKDPMLPGMLGSVTDGVGTYKVYPYPVNDVNLNIGSCWSTSTFRFTAPVAGIYYTSFSGIVGDGAGTQAACYICTVVNGAQTYWSYKDTISIWELQHVEVLYKLAAGDWVAWAMNIAPGPDSTRTSGAYRANHNTCTIWLVG
jgi:hypothetical protein